MTFLVIRARGGVEAERQERQRQRDEEAAAHQANMDAMRRLQEKAREKRRQMYGDNEPKVELSPELEAFKDRMIDEMEKSAGDTRVSTNDVNSGDGVAEVVDEEDVPALEDGAENTLLERPSRSATKSVRFVEVGESADENKSEQVDRRDLTQIPLSQRIVEIEDDKCDDQPPVSVSTSDEKEVETVEVSPQKQIEEISGTIDQMELSTAPIAKDQDEEVAIETIVAGESADFVKPKSNDIDLLQEAWTEQQNM